MRAAQQKGWSCEGQRLSSRLAKKRFGSQIGGSISGGLELAGNQRREGRRGLLEVKKRGSPVDSGCVDRGSRQPVAAAFAPGTQGHTGF